MIEGRSNRSELSRANGSDSIDAERVERLQDRVVAEPRRRAVRGRARHLEPHRQHALRLHADVQVGRLAGDREVAGVAVLDQELGAAVDLLLGLLVRDDREDDAHARLVAQLLERAHHRRERALHVVGAAAVEPVALDPRRELLLPGGDDVEVAVQDDRRAVLRARPPPPAPAARGLELLDRDVARLEPALYEPGGPPDAVGVEVS